MISTVRGALGNITRELIVEDDVFSEELIETEAESATRILFHDGSELSMGPSARMILDRYVYDPDAGTGEMVVEMAAGVFEFASGDIPSEGYDLRTPFGSLSVRGSAARFYIDENQAIVRPWEGDFSMDWSVTDKVTGETQRRQAVAARQGCLVAGGSGAIEYMSPTMGQGRLSGGVAPGAREVEIVGASDPNRWIVTIDGEEQSGADAVLHAGDTITWRSGEDSHGVIFRNWKQAQKLLNFDESQGEDLTAQDPTFGPDPVGTENFDDDRLLVVASVKPASQLVQVIDPFSCEARVLKFAEAEFLTNPAAINQSRLVGTGRPRGNPYDSARDFFFRQSNLYEGYNGLSSPN